MPLEVDFGIAWDWEYDKDFVYMLDSECNKRGLQSYLVYPYNIDETIGKVSKGEITFKTFLDRASESDSRFIPLIKSLKKRGVSFVNDSEASKRANDKATMHLEFLSSGLYVPYTIILSPYEDDPQFDASYIHTIGTPFIVKPAEGGGGRGVVLGVKTPYDIVKAREKHSKDKYLIQEEITPVVIKGRKAWFRAFYVYGNVIICWWDNQTGVYQRVTSRAERKYKLKELKGITKKIAEIARLNFFSTEIALTKAGRFVAVDYVNDTCDMRLKSKALDGVPDDVVRDIVRELVDSIRKLAKTKR
jgi:glutathione synthase/RimK-type ligase-like ATP-grasp enzyme